MATTVDLGDRVDEDNGISVVPGKARCNSPYAAVTVMSTRERRNVPLLDAVGSVDHVNENFREQICRAICAPGQAEEETAIRLEDG